MTTLMWFTVGFGSCEFIVFIVIAIMALHITRSTKKDA